MPRVRRPFTPPDQRHVTERETRCPLQLAQRDLLDERENVALEGGEVDELAVRLVPLPRLAFASHVRRGATRRRSFAVRRISSSLSLPLDRSEASAFERCLVLLALVVGKAVVAVGA